MNDININQLETQEIRDKERFFSIIETLLFISGEAIILKEIASIIDCEESYTSELLAEMKLKYEANDRGLVLVNLNNKYLLATKSENSEYVQKLLKTNVRQSLSRAALETLAIIVYKQPITRIEIDEIRGVKSDRAIQTLIDKNLIRKSGRKEVPGRPLLYATTEEFLSYFGIKNLNEMPSIESFIEEIEDLDDDMDEIALDKEN
ncbi:SMC-Scp complex subunit ScpB [Clostridium sediminicola]|uniref:SMC-Scp complex subunit ScpB n=1 Tax=Clostridium sediminicola TaxID=3114879 RepID=UPI0031F26837